MPAIGIDLGNRYACSAAWVRERIKIITNFYGYKLTPCIVSFHSGRILVGNAAEDVIDPNPENTIFDIKYILGCKFDDPRVMEFMRGRLFHVVNDNGIPKIKIENESRVRLYSCEEITGLIFINLKEIAESYLGCKITEAVLSVPVDFTEQQRSALINACKAADIHVILLINEPSAAALAYGLNNNVEDERIVLVLDIGFYSSKVCILRINSDSVFEIESNVKQNFLGAFDIQNRILDYISNKFRSEYPNVEINVTTLEKMRIASETAMRTLTKSNLATIEITNLEEGVDFTTTLQRQEFEEMCDDLLKKLFVPIQRALIEANMDKSEIHNVIFVGGSTRVPKIKILMKKFFTNTKTVLNNYINPNVVIAYGAALQAAIINDELHVTETHEGNKLMKVPEEPTYSKNIAEVKSQTSIKVTNQSSTILTNRSLSHIVVPPVGIAVGNSVACVAICIQGTIEIIVNDYGNRLMPALVHVLDDRSCLIGEPAENYSKNNPQNTISSVKCLIGNEYYQQVGIKYPFKIINDSGKPKILVEVLGGTETYSPEDMYFRIVERLKVHAEEYLGTAVNKAVIAVPLSYNEEVKKTIIEGCKSFGLNVVGVVFECTAAILAYKLEIHMPKTFRKVLTFDLGPHGLDLAIVIVKPGSEFEVTAHLTTADIKGRDFNQRLFYYLADEIRVKHGIKIDSHLEAADRLMHVTERAKVTLSTNSFASIIIDNLCEGVDFYTGITRQTFEGICKPLFDSMRTPVETLLLRANMRKSDIDDVVLIGGNSLIPRIRIVLKDLLGFKPIHSSIHPAEVVAYGVATQGAYLNGDTVDDEFNSYTKKMSSRSVPGKGFANVLLPITGAVESVTGAVKSLQTIILGKN